MLARRVTLLTVLATLALPAAAHAVFTPLNTLAGEPSKGTFVCAKNERSGTFSISGTTDQGLVGNFTAHGSAAFGPPDEFGFGAVTSFQMTFEVQGRAGQVLNGHVTGGSPSQSSTNEGACGTDVDFGNSMFINGVGNATWTADVKSRFGTYHDHGHGSVSNLSIYATDGTASGTAPNLVSDAPGKPVNVFRPRLSGNPDVGGVLHCNASASDWIGTYAVAKWEWLRNGTVVVSHNGAVGKNVDSYTVRPADAKHTLVCRTTADRGFALDSASVVSPGVIGNGCLVPNLRGKGLKRAKSALAAANCALGQVTRKKGKGVPFGHVLSQRPAAGATGPRGLKVAVVLRKKPS